MDKTQQTIVKSTQASRFNVTNIARHTHTNINSPAIIQPWIIYSGLITEGTFNSGTPANSLQPTATLLPSSFSVKYQLFNGAFVQVYEITHNLNTDFYSVVVTPFNVNPTSPTYPLASIQMNRNNFLVFFINSKTQADIDCSFSFILSTVLNTNPILPKYTT